MDLSNTKNYCFWDDEVKAIAVFCQGKNKLYNGFFYCDKEAIPLLEKSKYSIDTRGEYARCTISGRQVNIHKQLLAGELIDHINQNSLDNRVKNLRVASKKLNAINSKKISTNTTGHTGVYLHRNKRWRVAIFTNNKNIHVGVFKTKKEAIAARKNAELKYWGMERVNHKEYY